MKRQYEDLDYWRNLKERYFEAETTEAEEDALRSFLLTEDSNSAEFDALRAVMGYAIVGKRMHRNASGVEKRRASALYRPTKWIAAACVTIAVIGVSALLFKPNGNQVVAYVNGQRTTDPDIVMAMMQSTMEDMFVDNGVGDMESQMADMFEAMDGFSNE